MKLAEAIACVDRGIAKAQSMGLKLSFAVIDEFGQLVQMDRMDGASLMGPDIAEAKALTALNFRRPTSEVAKVDREVLEALAKAVHYPGGAGSGRRAHLGGRRAEGRDRRERRDSQQDRGDRAARGLDSSSGRLTVANDAGQRCHRRAGSMGSAVGRSGVRARQRQNPVHTRRRAHAWERPSPAFGARHRD